MTGSRALDRADSVQCGYLHDGKTEKTRCTHPAAYRSATVVRCEVHGGHHTFTEKWWNGKWHQITEYAFP